MRPEEWDDKRAKREVGDILQRVVELLDRYAVALQNRQDQVQNPAIAQYFIARGAECFLSRPKAKNILLFSKSDIFFPVVTVISHWALTFNQINLLKPTGYVMHQQV